MDRLRKCGRGQGGGRNSDRVASSPLRALSFVQMLQYTTLHGAHSHWLRRRRPRVTRLSRCIRALVGGNGNGEVVERALEVEAGPAAPVHGAEMLQLDAREAQLSSEKMTNDWTAGDVGKVAMQGLRERLGINDWRQTRSRYPVSSAVCSSSAVCCSYSAIVAFSSVQLP